MPNSRRTAPGLCAKRARNAVSCRIRAMKADMVGVTAGVESAGAGSAGVGAAGGGSAARTKKGGISDSAETAGGGSAARAAKSPVTNSNNLRTDVVKGLLPR
jgi:hypothetical protein